jgi:Flp pilus assembly protein TadD
VGQRQIGRYRIVRQLGAGGMGEVFEGFDDQLQRPVAIKGLAGGAGDALANERLRREALACGALSHPNIAHIYEIVPTAEGLFLVMEYVEGRTVAETLRAGPLAFDDVARIGEAVARALAAAHERNIVHRDIKPANVMVTPGGHVKVLDFGVAKRLAPVAEKQPGLTMNGTVVGTTAAMSPEQALGRDVDHRSDIFSLGSLLYEMASGVPAFSGDTTAEILVKVARGEHAPLTAIVPQAPPELAEIVERCLETAPSERFGSALEVAERLRKLRTSISFATRAMPSTSLPRLPPRRALYWGAGAIVLAGAAVAITVAVRSARPTVLTVAVVPTASSERDANALAAAAVSDAAGWALVQRSGVQVVPADEIEPAAVAGRRGVAIAREVGAGELLEAAIIHGGERDEVRVSLTATRGGDGTIRWSDEVDGPEKPWLRFETRVGEAVGRAYGGRAADPAFVAREATEEAMGPYLAALARWTPRHEAPDPETFGLLEKAVELAPRWVAPALGLADAELALWRVSRDPGRLDRAGALIAQVEQLAPKDPRAALCEARLQLARGDLEAARTAARALVANRGDDPSAWAALGEIELADRRFDAAAEDFVQAKNRRDSWVFARDLARVAVARGDLSAARKGFETALLRSPDNPELLADLADLAERNGELERAERLARHAAALRPSADNLLRLATSLLDLQRPAAAAKVLQTAVEGNPLNVEVDAALALALRWAGRDAESRVAARRALEVAAAAGGAATEDVRVQRGRALACACLNRGSDAVIAAHAALSLAPDDPRTAYCLALVAALNGDDAASRTWAHEAQRRGAPAAWLARPPFVAVLH